MYGTDLPGFELEDEERPSVSAWTTYCTPGTSSYGCEATIGASGVPSVSATSGFNLTVCNANGNTTGIFFYGTTGRKDPATAWGSTSSYFCVLTPVRRVPSVLITTGQSLTCEGTASRDLAAYWTLNGNKPPAGTQVQAQFWYRDPNGPNPKSQMSDAIEFVLCP